MKPPFSRGRTNTVLGDKSNAFINDPLVRSINKELNICKLLIIQDGTTSRGKLKNAVGKFIDVSEQKEESIASHILQGYETLALHTAIEQLDGNIQLLCHDGFVTEEAINTKAIEQAFYEKTGLEIILSSEILIPKM